jgi:hypothetical protein
MSLIKTSFGKRPYLCGVYLYYHENRDSLPLGYFRNGWRVTGLPENYKIRYFDIAAEAIKKKFPTKKNIFFLSFCLWQANKRVTRKTGKKENDRTAIACSTVCYKDI